MASAVFMSEEKIYGSALDLPVMKPFADIKDHELNSYTIYFDVKKQVLKNRQKAELFTAETKLKNGSVISVKSVRIEGGAFTYRHTRIKGDILTSTGEIAAQLNRLFAEE
jgi:hypothetical protein